MAITQIIKNTCKKLGENNKPTYVVMAIATVKGICRPTFTMMDKTEDPQTKKYTALREGLTELIAIPSYWACGEITGKIAKKVFNKDAVLAKRAEKNLMFVGVCTAALFVIPAVCSATIKPIMNKLGIKLPDEKKADNNHKTDITIPSEMSIPAIKEPNNNKIYNYPAMQAFANRPQTGLKVGGL